MNIVKIKIPYVICDCGDGSAIVHFCKTLEDAKTIDKYYQESDHNFAEEAAFEATLDYDPDKNEIVNIDRYTTELVKEAKNWLEENE